MRSFWGFGLAGSILVMVTLAMLGSPVGAQGCSGGSDPAVCDLDGDLIPDEVEEVICGLVTCADGSEDTDGDSVPDWLEIVACGDFGCVDPLVDTDGLGIPDWLEVLVCGDVTCADGGEDVDGDGVADWVEWLACGSATCALPDDDRDRNGVADAVEIARFEVEPTPVPTSSAPGGPIAFTGSEVRPVVIAGFAVMAVGGAFLWMSRRRKGVSS